MKKQGAWTKWGAALERKVTWADLWKSELHRVKFLIQAVYDVLPSPGNLHTWGKTDQRVHFAQNVEHSSTY